MCLRIIMSLFNMSAISFRIMKHLDSWKNEYNSLHHNYSVTSVGMFKFIMWRVINFPTQPFETNLWNIQFCIFLEYHSNSNEIINKRKKERESNENKKRWHSVNWNQFTRKEISNAFHLELAIFTRKSLVKLWKSTKKVTHILKRDRNHSFRLTRSSLVRLG